MSSTPTSPSQAEIESAIEQTLVGWGAELDTGRKFWWMAWNHMIRDVTTASAGDGAGPLQWWAEIAMSTVCQRKAETPKRGGTVVALDGVRVHRLALVIADDCATDSTARAT